MTETLIRSNALRISETTLVAAQAANFYFTAAQKDAAAIQELGSALEIVPAGEVTADVLRHGMSRYEGRRRDNETTFLARLAVAAEQIPPQPDYFE